MSTALIIGAGASGLLHSLALKSAGIPISAIYDPEPGRAALLGELVGGRPCTSFDDAAARNDCTVVAICSPPIHHVAQAIALARPGRLTLLEKPVALREEDLIRLSGYANIVPTLQWRAGRSARQLRAAIARNHFGPRPQLTCDLRLWRDDAYYANGRRGLDQWGCGAMLSIGIHAIDLALFIMNRPVRRAHGREWRGRPALDVTTQSEVTIDFDDGAAARIRLTTDAEGHNDVRLAITGDDASAMLLADEADPTANAVQWRGPAAPDVNGATGSPLLVPFVHEAIAAFRSGGQTVSVADVADAHRIACALERV
jgi:predicted dehydrogenase